MSDRIDSGRTIQAFGPCDEYGEPKPGGVARVRMVYRSSVARHDIVLDYAEAVILLEELQHATTEIEANRSAAAARQVLSSLRMFRSNINTSQRPIDGSESAKRF